MSVIVIRNQIHIIGQIDNQLANTFIDQFNLALSYPAKNIELHMCSPGGSISSTEKMLDVIKLSYKPIFFYIHNTNYYTGVASAASVIASYTKKISIDVDATFMIHHARVNNKVIDNDEDVLYWMEKTDMDYDIINNLVKNETVMNADLAQSLGFVDTINYKKYDILTECF